MWQDYVFVTGSIAITILMIPLIYDVLFRKQPVNIITALSYFSITLIFCYTYYTLGLWFAAIPFNTMAWLIVFVGSWRAKNGK